MYLHGIEKYINHMAKKEVFGGKKIYHDLFKKIFCQLEKYRKQK